MQSIIDFLLILNIFSLLFSLIFCVILFCPKTKIMDSVQRPLFRLLIVFFLFVFLLFGFCSLFLVHASENPLVFPFSFLSFVKITFLSIFLIALLNCKYLHFLLFEMSPRQIYKSYICTFTLVARTPCVTNNCSRHKYVSCQYFCFVFKLKYI